MKVRLKVITPIHIGNGEKYSAFEYILENGLLKKYSIEKIISKAEERKLLESLASYFKRETLPNKRLYSLNEICNTNPSLRKIILEQEPEYIIRAEIGKEEEVEEFIKSSGKIYIPGSEIKGSIRRALLFHVLKEDKKVFEKLLNMLKEAKEKKNFKTVSKRIENIVFRGREEDVQYDIMQYDIMKLLRVSDTNLLKPSEKNLKVKKIGLFYITSQKRKEFPSEVVLAGTQFEFNINLSLSAKRLADVLDCHHIIKSLFLDSNNEDTTIEGIIKIWKEAEKECIKLDPYLVPVSDNEILSSTKNKKRANQILRFINQLKEGKRSVVRIGKHEGYLFTTVMALLKEKNEKTFEKVFKLSAPRVSGIPNKTRKLTMKEKLPLGFCSVESI
ncbi:MULTISPECIES: type III-A CRISPR-associated RAMP protein Csm5 [unclassified Desulfurobacterium]|uniref:type III-A CRISPR-associated RAMP protein Csm5 n=1 Tax=Desulfurobacterium sp. TC5-1 TaxID=1158318 RepID=UPI0003B2E9FB|nr:type III-A CRISPR-associated RAMP protein Csm5 [Desulfurobacterium sp. TC5-1]